MIQSSEKLVTGEQEDRYTDGPEWFHRTMSGWRRASNIKIISYALSMVNNANNFTLFDVILQRLQ